MDELGALEKYYLNQLDRVYQVPRTNELWIEFNIWRMFQNSVKLISNQGSIRQVTPKYSNFTKCDTVLCYLVNPLKRRKLMIIRTFLRTFNSTFIIETFLKVSQTVV